MSSSIELLDRVIAQAKSMREGTNSVRPGLLATLQQLQYELETPEETFFRTTWGQPSLHLALAFANDIKAYEVLSLDNDTPKSSEEIALPSGADPILVGRMMRHLAAMGVVRQVDVDRFAPTKFTKLLQEQVWADTLKFIFDDFGPVRPRTASYLKSIGWQTPTDPENCAIQYAFDLPKGTSMFGWFGMHPEIGSRFGSMMIAWMRNKPFWADENAYPVKERLRSVEEADGVLLVDVGGGKGHDLEVFKARYPELKGRLICQDLPYLIPEIQVEGVEPMAHDFNTPQPVRGAQAYFLHQVLHDYNDDKCINILKQIVPAMKPGASKILIAELIIPDKDAHFTSTALDLELMQCLAARERTEAQFRDMLDKAGLKVSGIFKHPEAHDSIIEAVPI